MEAENYPRLALTNCSVPRSQTLCYCFIKCHLKTILTQFSDHLADCQKCKFIVKKKKKKKKKICSYTCIANNILKTSLYLNKGAILFKPYKHFFGSRFTRFNRISIRNRGTRMRKSPHLRVLVLG